MGLLVNKAKVCVSGCVGVGKHAHIYIHTQGIFICLLLLSFIYCFVFTWSVRRVHFRYFHSFLPSFSFSQLSLYEADDDDDGNWYVDISRFITCIIVKSFLFLIIYCNQSQKKKL